LSSWCASDFLAYKTFHSDYSDTPSYYCTYSGLHTTAAVTGKWATLFSYFRGMSYSLTPVAADLTSLAHRKVSLGLLSCYHSTDVLFLSSFYHKGKFCHFKPSSLSVPSQRVDAILNGPRAHYHAELRPRLCFCSRVHYHPKIATVRYEIKYFPTNSSLLPASESVSE